MCCSTPLSSPAIKDKQLRWTTYDNLNTWFRNRKEFLVEKGFAWRGVEEKEDKIVIDEAIHRRIINVDKTEILLDGSNSRVGGRLVVSFRNPNSQAN